jgi:hypothetical protein
MVGARDQHVAGFERPTQSVQCLCGKFRQLVQEEHALMREADFARLGADAAANKRGHRRRMVRRAERARTRQTPTFK